MKVPEQAEAAGREPKFLKCDQAQAEVGGCRALS